jgi:hypothetical protein
MTLANFLFCSVVRKRSTTRNETNMSQSVRTEDAMLDSKINQSLPVFTIYSSSLDILHYGIIMLVFWLGTLFDTSHITWQPWLIKFELTKLGRWLLSVRVIKWILESPCMTKYSLRKISFLSYGVIDSIHIHWLNSNMTSWIISSHSLRSHRPGTSAPETRGTWELTATSNKAYQSFNRKPEHDILCISL